MNDRFDLHIITQHHSEVYCGYFRLLVFGNSLTFSHIPPCFHAKPPNFPCLFDPRGMCTCISTASAYVDTESDTYIERCFQMCTVHYGLNKILNPYRLTKNILALTVIKKILVKLKHPAPAYIWFRNDLT